MYGQYTGYGKSSQGKGRKRPDYKAVIVSGERPVKRVICSTETPSVFKKAIKK
jgi:hypothetical protein